MARELELIGLGAADGLVGPKPAHAGDGAKHAAAHTECLNCGAPLHGRFCHDCGQTADDHHRSIFHLMWEAVEGLTHLDGRLARTLPPLFLRPGRLARDHFEGRRQRHVPPFRLFLVSLLLFMLALEFVVHHGGEDGHVRVAGPAAAGAPVKPEAAPAPSPPPPGFIEPTPPTEPQIAPEYRVTSSQLDLADRAQALATGAPVPGVTPDQGELAKSPMASFIVERARAAGLNPEYFTTVMFGWAHRLAVLLLPIFALLLTGCYFYKRRFYVYDHLVVSMQFLSFIFLISAAAWVLPSPVRGWAVGAATIWTPINLFMILRGAYGSSKLGAALKAFGLWIATLCLFLLLLIGILIVTLGQMK